MPDKARWPRHLIVHRIWVPENPSDTRAPIAYASDRSRQIVGAASFFLGAILALGIAASGGPFWFVFMALLLGWLGIAFGAGGKAGYYTVEADGSPGEYAGKARPDLSGMRRAEPQDFLRKE